MKNEMKIEISLFVSIVIFFMQVVFACLLIIGSMPGNWFLRLLMNVGLWIPVLIVSFVNMILARRINDITQEDKLLVRATSTIIFIFTMVVIAIFIFIYFLAIAAVEV